MVRNRSIAHTIIGIAASCLLCAPYVSGAGEKTEEGFVSLFDGKTLDGWHLMNDAKFVAEDGVIKLNGEWNEYDIKLVGSRLEVRLNGELVSTSDSTGNLTRGYLGLQAEHGFHEYRNFRIKDLGNDMVYRWSHDSRC